MSWNPLKNLIENNAKIAAGRGQIFDHIEWLEDGYVVKHQTDTGLMVDKQGRTICMITINARSHWQSRWDI